MVVLLARRLADHLRNLVSGRSSWSQEYICSSEAPLILQYSNEKAPSLSRSYLDPLR